MFVQISKYIVERLSKGNVVEIIDDIYASVIDLNDINTKHRQKNVKKELFEMTQ